MRTRTLFIGALALVLMALPAIAAASGWRPRVGFEVGPNLGHMNAGPMMGHGDWSFGGGAGLVAGWQLGGGWALETGPGWQRQLGHGTGNIVAVFTGPQPLQFTFDQTVALDRIEMPMRLAFRPPGTAWSLEAGVSPAWLARAERTSDLASWAASSQYVSMARGGAEPNAAIFEQAGTFSGSRDWTSMFHRWDAAAVAGVGWDRPMAAQVFRVRLRWQEGLTDIGTFLDPVRVRAVTASFGMLW